MAGCCCENEGVKLIYPCSGGADVGALSDRLARKLAKAGFGKMSCLAGVGADISGFISSAECAELNITIDGCQLRCAARNFENRGIKTLSFVLTELGFEKGKTKVNEGTIETALEILAKELQNMKVSAAISSTDCCG